MSNPDGTETDNEEKENRRSSGTWKSVDPEVWKRRGPPPSGLRKLIQALQRVGSLFLHPVALPLTAMMGVLGFISTFVGAYYIGGPNFFGPILLGIWGILLTLLVVGLEKTGYWRNFEAWDFPVRKILYGIPGLFLGLAFFYIFLTVLGHH